METTELKIVDSDGSVVTMTQMTKEMIAKVDDESLQDLALMSKLLKQRFKFIDDELKTRLEDGHHFTRVRLVESTKRMMPADNNELKQYFVGKYGYSAVELKSNKKLKDEFGKMITSDVDANTVEEITQRVKWE